MIRLEPLGERHLDALASLAHDPDVQRFTRVPVPPPPGFARAWLSLYEHGRAEGAREGFAILDAASAEPLGIAVAPTIDRTGLTAELGYAIAPGARGRGVATAALAQLTDWALAEGMLRLELQIDVDNPASKRVAERCGYEREGIMRSVHVKQGLRADVEIWARLAS